MQSATQVKSQPSGLTLASAGDSLRLLILRDGEETTISYEVRIAPEPSPPHTMTTSQLADAKMPLHAGVPLWLLMTAAARCRHQWCMGWIPTLRDAGAGGA